MALSRLLREIPRRKAAIAAGYGFFANSCSSATPVTPAVCWRVHCASNFGIGQAFSQITPMASFMSRRIFGSDSKSFDYNKEIDEINEKFAEAREEIEMALESKDTVYFNEEAESAQAVVNETLEMFEALLAKLPDSEKAALHRSMGLRMEQLKAEVKQLDE